MKIAEKYKIKIKKKIKSKTFFWLFDLHVYCSKWYEENVGYMRVSKQKKRAQNFHMNVKSEAHSLNQRHAYTSSTKSFLFWRRKNFFAGGKWFDWGVRTPTYILCWSTMRPLIHRSPAVSFSAKHWITFSLCCFRLRTLRSSSLLSFERINPTRNFLRYSRFDDATKDKTHNFVNTYNFMHAAR